jgi:four helix bundle protein
MIKKNKSVIVEKSFDFAVQVVGAYKTLTANEKEYVLSKQLLRSGTAIGALSREAQNAESRADFIHKLGIAQKECDETLYWLELLYNTKYINKINFNSLYTNAESLLKMIRSAIVTTKKRIKSDKL